MISKFIFKYVLNGLIHGTITQTGIICKKIPIYITQFASGGMLKKLKYFEVMLTIFQFLRMWEIVEFWLVNANKHSWFAQW